jgi:hypothetical protein
MNKLKLALVTISLFLVQVPAMAIEEPDFEVISEFDGVELRRYAPYLVAEVDVSGGIMDGGNESFRILAGYIFGDNSSSTKMAMTAPVAARPADQGEKMAMTAPVTATSAAGDERTTFAFVMEDKYTMDTLPIPDDDRIRIREVPERVMAVRRYSGRWSEAKYEKNLEELRNVLLSEEVTTTGEPVLARYNSPFSLPFMRRNEVMLKVAND